MRSPMYDLVLCSFVLLFDFILVQTLLIFVVSIVFHSFCT